MPIVFHAVSYQYPGSPEPVFSRIDLYIAENWRTAIVGRNGKGKSTLLKLISGELSPTAGRVETSVSTHILNEEILASEDIAFHIAKDAVGPFRRWEEEMEVLLAAGDDRSMERYHSVFQEYTEQNGFGIDARIVKECGELGVDEAMLQRPFSSLSGGERTRVLIAAMFLREDELPMLDEPTNHLDLPGRERLAAYLRRKQGFIVVSHDRSFLDACVDHIVAIVPTGLRIHPGTYSSWREQREKEERSEAARMENLHREITVLEQEAEQRRRWSAVTEKEKNSAADSGFVSHKAAKMMKRALTAERRIERAIEEKKSLLQDRERSYGLLLPPAPDGPEVVLTIDNAEISYDGRTIIRGFSLTLRRSERVALIGPNGCGKTSLLRVVRGERVLSSGTCHRPARLAVENVYQQPRWERGSLRSHVRDIGIDETRYRTVLGALGVHGEIFDRPLESFSFGERKKADLCRSLLVPHHLLVWDEPVNYIDIDTKERLESMLLSASPTMLFTEHDRAFVEAVATRIIDLSQWNP